MKKLMLILVLIISLLVPFSSIAGQANLAWDPPDISTDVTGYMIHYGTASGSYSQALDVGKTTSYTVSNLIDGQTYYFAVTAYNAVGYESVYSNEVSIVMAPLQYILMSNKTGTGQGTISGLGINCGQTCLATYNPNTIINLTATPSTGSTFMGWSGGGCKGTGTCSINITTNITVTADFRLGVEPTPPKSPENIHLISE